MTMPTFEQIMPVVLELSSTVETITIKDVVGLVADHFDLSEDERELLLPSGKQRVIYNRTYWASFDLFKAGLLTKQKKGVYSITQRGNDVLAVPRQRNVDSLA